MFLSKVANDFLDYYNSKKETSYTAKSFFDDVLYPIVLDSEYPLNFIINSPFHTNAIKKEDRRRSDFNKGLLDNFHKKVEDGIRDGSILFGNSASEDTKYRPYSGLLPDVKIKDKKEDVYLSWIAQCLSCGVSGGWLFLIDSPSINFLIFEGWATYRKKVDNGKVADKSINSWNSIYLKFLVDGNKELSIRDNGKLIPHRYAVLCHSISNLLKEDTVNSLIYYVSKQNKTIGFTPIDLTIFRSDSIDVDFLNSSIMDIGKFGNIGINSVFPKLRYVTNKNFTKYLDLIKSIIMTKSSPKNTLVYAKEVAELIRTYNDKERKESHVKLVQRLIGQSNKTIFLQHLYNIVENGKGAAKETVNKIVELMEYAESLTVNDFKGFSAMIAIYYRAATVNKK